MLTDPQDFVVDIFSGSNTTGWVAESLGRRWLSVDINLQYVAGSSFRFAGDIRTAESCYSRILAGEELVIAP